DLAEDSHSIQLVQSCAVGEAAIVAITLRKWTELRDGYGDRVKSVMLSGAELRSMSFSLQVGRAFFRPQDRSVLRAVWRALHDQLAAKDAIINDLRHRLSNGVPAPDANGNRQTPLLEGALEVLTRVCVRMHRSTDGDVASEGGPGED